jgi:hypothetical protein
MEKKIMPSIVKYCIVKSKVNCILHCKKSESYLPQESVWLAGGPTQTS